jgi:DNA repair protein RadC
VKLYVVTSEDTEIEPRPKEKLARNGASSLSNAELLAIVLRSGGAEPPMALANRLLTKFRDLRGVALAPPEKLAKVAGVGPTKAREVHACIELGRRLFARAPGDDPGPITSPQDVADYLLPRLTDVNKEHFFTVLLDVKSNVLGLKTISIGTLDSSLVHPREVFKEAIAASASSIIVAHNHPSGDTTPSPEDRRVTARLVEAGKILGIEVLDHIIIAGDDGWSSMNQLGMM